MLWDKEKVRAILDEYDQVVILEANGLITPTESTELKKQLKTKVNSFLSPFLP